MKTNKALIQKIIAVTLSLTGIATTFAGCNNSGKEKEQTQTKIHVETTTENETEKTYFESLKEEEKIKIKVIMAGLHIPSEWIKNDDIVSEIFEFIKSNKNYVENVQFIGYLKNNYPNSNYPNSYYTSDGNILFNKSENYFYIKNINNNISFKSIQVDDHGKTLDIFEDAWYDKNNNLVSDIIIDTGYGKFSSKSSAVVKYSKEILEPEKRTRHYSDNINHISILPNSKIVNMKVFGGSTSMNYTMRISKEEIEQLITYFDTHNQTQLQKLAYDLIKKYEGKYERFSYRHTNKDDIYISIDECREDIIELTASYRYPTKNSNIEEFELECDITTEEKQKMMLLIKNNDYVGIINYTKQLEKKYNTNIEETTDYAKTYSIN